MTREAALQIVDALEKHYRDSPYPGQSKDSIQLFQGGLRQLEWGVQFNLETSSATNWAEIFYSAHRWEKWGYEQIRTIMLESIHCVRKRVQMTPSEFFDKGQ